MHDDAELRTFGPDRWREALTLVARAFQTEPWLVTFFGDDPVPRFAQSHRFFQAAKWNPEDIHLGAFIDEVLVGVCLISPSGSCHLCHHVDPEARPTDPLFVDDWIFEVNAQKAHADQGEHAWLSRVVVDPAIQGAGIGRAMLDESLARLRVDGASTVLLECQPHREAWYGSLGFVRVRRFEDPGGPDAMLMRAGL